MALIEAPIRHFIGLKDRGGNIVTLSFKSNGFVSLTADQLSDALLAAFSPLTFAKVIRYGYTSESIESDDSTDDTNGEVSTRAEISVALLRETPPDPGQTKRATITIPAPVDAMFSGTAGPLFNVVTPLYAPLQTFLELFEPGLILPSFTLSDFQNILDPAVSGNVLGKRVHRKSRSG